jgi:Mrp family chromosome partitioning ATPase
LLVAYLKRHAEIHLKGADYELLARQTEELRSRLQDTEKEVNDIRSKVGGVSMEESKAALSKDLASIRSAILDTEMQLAAASPTLSSDFPLPGRSLQSDSPVTNAQPLTGYDAAALRLSSGALMERAHALRAREQDYLSRFTEDNPLVKSVRLQIAEVDRQLAGLAVTNPAIVLGTLSADPAMALHARMHVLTNQLQVALAEANRLNDLENALTEILRRKDIQEQNYKHLATSLERERFDTALEFSKLSNIVVNQEPSPPLKNAKAAQKLAMMVLGGVLGGGVALVFLFELFLDPRLKRASQIEQAISLPHFISIPRVRGNGVKALHQGLAGQRQITAGVETPGRMAGSEWGGSRRDGDGEDGELRSYYEALRDRIVIYFDRVNLRRKPKLVGLAGCHPGAGVSTIAQGLAETLSETGGGKVLLVNLNSGAEEARSYLRGRPAMQLTDALEQTVEGGDGESESLLLAALDQSGKDYHPVRSREFDQLIPRLKASDFDYIVFDMPPLQPTSVSYRLSGFLDKMLIVAECEKTHLESLKRAAAMLQESNARVATVLNKKRDYVPGWLRQAV